MDRFLPAGMLKMVLEDDNISKAKKVDLLQEQIELHEKAAEILKERLEEVQNED